MTINPLDLNALIGSRICHDLISPLGAIGNGVELLAMNGAAASPEMTLITESIENANARIRFFRIAFGATGAGQIVSTREISGILRDLARAARVRINWPLMTDLPRREVKLAFLLLQCFESAMPRGGEVQVATQHGRWTISGTADRLSVVDDHWNLLRGVDADTDIDAALVHFALAPLAAKAATRDLRVDLQPNTLSVGF